ncbi:nrps [Epichloe bromicola]|uniref:Nrps n=1 Tax=Epichloe bromicola TaxID=79588 RepID=A0ABQ0CXE1_9HYPO
MGLPITRKTAKAVSINLTAYAHKVTIQRGTLNQPRFGIKDEHVWGTIQADLDVVLHVAWPVNYNLALSEFRSSLQAVDVVSEFVVVLVEKGLNHVPGHASILNLLNSQPASWTSMLPAVAQSMQNVLDTPVELIPARAWLGRIEQALQRAISNRDTSIVSLIDALPAVKLLDSFRSTFSETRAQKWEVKRVLATECMRVLPAVQSSWLNEWIS